MSSRKFKHVCSIELIKVKNHDIDNRHNMNVIRHWCKCSDYTSTDRIQMLIMLATYTLDWYKYNSETTCCRAIINHVICMIERYGYEDIELKNLYIELLGYLKIKDEPNWSNPDPFFIQNDINPICCNIL